MMELIEASKLALSVLALDSSKLSQESMNVINALHDSIKKAENQKPIAYLACRGGVPTWDEDGFCKDDVYPVDAEDDRTSLPVYARTQAAQQLATEDVGDVADDCTPNHICNGRIVHLPLGEICNVCGQ